MMLVSDQKRKKLNIKQLLQALTVPNILSRIDAVLPWNHSKTYQSDWTARMCLLQI